MKKPCLLPDCLRPARARGLCCLHYEQARRAVERAETTWARLEAAGFCRSAAHHHAHRPVVRPRHARHAGSRNRFASWAGTQLVTTHHADFSPLMNGGALGPATHGGGQPEES